MSTHYWAHCGASEVWEKTPASPQTSALMREDMQPTNPLSHRVLLTLIVSQGAVIFEFHKR